MNNQFDKDERMVTIKNILVILSLLAISVLTCHKAKAQSTEVKFLLNNLGLDTLDTQYSDTTQVIYVLLREDYFEEMRGDSFQLIPYPSLETIYGFHVQNWKPYSVVFYDFQWNIIEDEPLYIRKRKLFKK